MLLERNQAAIGVVFMLLLAIGTFFAVGLSGGAFDSGTALTATFTDAASLQSGDYVYLAGTRAGKVKGVNIVGETVEVDFLLESEEVPNDSDVIISVENLLGRRALVVEPGSSTTPFRSGDTIDITRTGTPIDLPELGDETVNLLATANIEALQQLNTALANITEDAEQDVADLLVGLEDVSQILIDRRGEIDRALGSAERIAVIVEEKDDELLTIVDNFNVVLAELVANRQDLSRLVRSTANASDIGADLLEERRAQIDRVLSELDRDLQVVQGRQVDVAAIMGYMGINIDGFASIGYEGGEAKTYTPNWGNVFVSGLGAVGVEALFACNGTLDGLLSAIVGPDPGCEAAAADASPPALLARDGVDLPLGHLFTDTLRRASADRAAFDAEVAK